MDEELIFAEAIEQPSPAECAAYLDRVCAHDFELRARLERLIQAHRHPAPFLDAPDPALIEQRTQGLVRESVGSTIGPYRLLEQIGEGGMGLVYMAEQQKPVRRAVALKIIKPGMNSRQVIRRFESERQALALMEHPNIAKVLDVGTTESGNPYFVMELVRGIAITDYCDQAKLSQRERLELFINVCHAVQHAHQKGIIHRDLKPANVLVTMHDDVAVPKVIDFGVAKAIDRTSADHTQVTNFAQMIGTPTYMSPEQAQMSCLDVDTRSDVYSLGVLLYELLTGTTPFEKQRLRDAGYVEVQRILREEEPPAPSSRIATLKADSLSTLAANRRVDVRRFSQIVRGDLDWIVMKSLEKDRTRRYESASALAADVRRYLADEPVEARPPSAAYRLRKFARRNRSLVTFASLLIGFLVASYAGLVVMNMLISGERFKIQQERNRAQEGEAKLAESEETLRKHLYAADMQLAWTAYNMGDGKQAREKLQKHIPAQGAADNRGFEWHYLSRLCADESRVLSAQTRAVFGLAFSPDGTRLAATSADRTVVVWNMREGTPQLTLRDFADDVNAADFSRDGELLATADETGSVRIWNMQTGSEVARLSGFEYPVGRVFFTADENVLVCTEVHWESHKAHLSTWDLASRERRRIVRGYRLLAFNAQRKIAAAVSDAGELSTWTVPELELQTTWPGQQAQALCAEFAPDGSKLATGCRDGEVGLWNLTDYSVQRLKAEPAQAIRSVAFSKDSRLLVAVGDDAAARIWNAASGTLQKVLPGNHIRLWSAAVSPDGKTLAIGCGDGSVELRDAAALVISPRKVATSQVDRATAVNAAGNHLAIVDTDERSVLLVDLETGKRLNRILLPVDRRATALSFDADSLWVGDHVGNVRRFDPESGRLEFEFRPHNGWIESLHVSPAGRYVATNSRDDHLTSRIWDTHSGMELLRYDNRPYMPNFRLNTIRGFFGEALAIACRHENVHLWETSTRLGPKPIYSHESFVESAVLSPDGTILATGTRDRLIHCWNVSAGREFATLRGHRDTQIVLAFSPDCRTLASAGNDGDLKLWHLPTTQFLCDLARFTGAMRFLAFTPDGRRLIGIADTYLGKTDGTSEVFVWDAAIGVP